MWKLAKLVAVLAAFRYFVFDLVATRLDLTSGGQITAIVCVSIVAMMLGITFVMKK